LRHHGATECATAEQAIRLNCADIKAAGWAFELHHLLASAAAGDAPADAAAIDRISQDFHRNLPALAGWRPRHRIGPKAGAVAPIVI
jgi:hypothetical protein